MRSKEFREGQRLFWSGKCLAIPYPPGSHQYNEFERGWVQALKASPDQAAFTLRALKDALPDDWLQRRLLKRANSAEGCD